MSSFAGGAGSWDGWFKVSASAVEAGSRLHTRLDGRYVTVFSRRNRVSCIDSICHHAGGPLTEGPLQDIEDLDVTVVLCPWHRYMVTLDGHKVFQGLSFVEGKPGPPAWKQGKRVQRQHEVSSDSSGTFVRLGAVRPSVDVNIEAGAGAGAGAEGEAEAGGCGSDQHASSELCGSVFALHPFEPIRVY